LRGSVVGIQTVEVAGMYTGKMISELMATVERVGQRVQRQQAAEQEELRAIFAMQIPVGPGDRVGQVFMGAA